MGSTGASVSVVLTDTSSVATITRSIDARGKVAEALHNEVEDIHTVAEFVSYAFGAQPIEVARLLFVNEGDIYTSTAGDMDLDRHLEKLLPIGPVQELLTQAREGRRSVSSLLKTQRGHLRLSKDELAQLAQRRVELEAELRSLEQSEPELLNRDRELEELRRRVEEQRLFDERLGQWQAEANALFADEPMGSEPEVIMAALESQHRTTELRVRELVATRGRLEGECSAIERSLELLEGDNGDQCPLCEQPLSPTHRTRVVSKQHERLAQAQLELQQVEDALDETQRWHHDLNSRIAILQSFLARRPAPIGRTESVPEDIDSMIEQSRTALEAQRDRRRQIFDTLADVRERIALAENDRRIEEQVIDAFRKDALLEATENSVSTFVADVRSGLVSPLGHELSLQWKRFRPRTPWSLTVGEDGRLAIEMNGEHRSFGALSAGERTIALILLRVALSVAFTSARFLVLDEPLEHLDPRTRRLLISSLALAVEQRLVDQLIVSTYEEAIVRRLQRDELASAIYIG